MPESQAPESAPVLEISDELPGLATLTLSRPSQRNALREADLMELLRLFERVNADPSIHVLIFQARTDNQAKPVFCAGYSMDDFDSPDHEATRFGQVADALAALRPITLAALNGSVYGGATDLALACDIRWALSGTEWRMPACALGIHFYPSGLKRYLAHLGISRAKQAFLSASAMPVAWLENAGLFAAVCDSQDSIQAEIRKWVGDMLRLSPLATQLTKATLTEMADGTADTAEIALREIACADSAHFAQAKAQALTKRQSK